MAAWRAASEYILDALAIPDDLREVLYRRNAAALFGLASLLDG